MNGRTLSTALTTKLQRKNSYLVEWEETDLINPITQSRFSTKGAVWSAGDGDFYLGVEGIEKKKNIGVTMSLASGVSAATLPATFFDLKGGKSLRQLEDECQHLTEQKEESIGGVECFVITGNAHHGSMVITETRWIGKKDYLIHKAVSEIRNHESKPFFDGSESQTNSDRVGTTTNSMKQPMIFTEIHENIILNEEIEKAVFSHEFVTATNH